MSDWTIYDQVEAEARHDYYNDVPEWDDRPSEAELSAEMAAIVREWETFDAAARWIAPDVPVTREDFLRGIDTDAPEDLPF